mgnify:CR=1 FL=1
MPALNPDVAIIHVQQADEEGNAQIWGIAGDCQAGANAAEKVIVSCERIVDRDTIGQDWKLWCDRGYLDFVCPMDYTASSAQFRSATRRPVSRQLM